MTDIVSPATAPSPATTRWVPVGPGPIPDFRYRGDWAAGSYSDGDIVVYGGVAYLCVQGTSSPPVAWAPPSISPSYGTALPASPVDGQEHILVDSVTNPSYQWRFRYNAGSSSAYKWEFVGGPPISSEVDADESTTSSSYGDLATVGPQVTVPRGGDYEIAFGAQMYMQPSNTVGMNASFAMGATAAVDADSISLTSKAAPGYFVIASEARQRRKTAVAASAVICMKYQIGPPSDTAHFRYRYLKVTPVRVS